MSPTKKKSAKGKPKKVESRKKTTLKTEGQAALPPSRKPPIPVFSPELKIYPTPRLAF